MSQATRIVFAIVKKCQNWHKRWNMCEQTLVKYWMTNIGNNLTLPWPTAPPPPRPLISWWMSRQLAELSLNNYSANIAHRKFGQRQPIDCVNNLNISSSTSKSHIMPRNIIIAKFSCQFKILQTLMPECAAYIQIYLSQIFIQTLVRLTKPKMR